MSTSGENAEQQWLQVGTKDKSVPWYEKDIKNLCVETRHLLETYAGIPSYQVLDHVYAIVRDMPIATDFTNVSRGSQDTASVKLTLSPLRSAKKLGTSSPTPA